MTDEHGSHRFSKLKNIFKLAPKNKEQLLAVLRDANAKYKIIDSESLAMLEGVMQISDLTVGDVMVPKSNMVLIQDDMEHADIFRTVIKSGHSRFPVVGESADEIRGVLLAKDLLVFALDKSSELNLANILRKAMIVPESKKLFSLLKEFRIKRNHLAIVVDEYGSIGGLITIEDIIEQIVGDIIDEHDVENVETFIIAQRNNCYVVKGLTPIEEFNEYFKCEWDDSQFDTVGGLVSNKFGHVPANNEEIVIDDFRIKVMLSDKRRISLLKVMVDSAEKEQEQQ